MRSRAASALAAAARLSLVRRFARTEGFTISINEPHSCGFPEGLLAQPFYGWVKWGDEFLRRGLSTSFSLPAVAGRLKPGPWKHAERALPLRRRRIRPSNGRPNNPSGKPDESGSRTRASFLLEKTRSYNPGYTELHGDHTEETLLKLHFSSLFLLTTFQSQPQEILKQNPAVA